MSRSSAYPPLDGLFDLACRNGVDIRPTLLRVLTDLYVQKAVHTTDEERQYIELALGLIGTADAPTRAAVSSTLRSYAAAPRAVLEKLAVLAGETLPEAPIRAEMPAEAPATHEPNDLAELFLSASPDERRLILANLDVAPAKLSSPPPAVAEVIAALERAAMQRNSGEFGRTLAGALGIDPVLAERITHDASGEPLVVAARALGMQAPVLQRILLFLDPAIGQSVARVFDLAKLFEETTPQAARAMASIWKGQAKRRRPVHEPVTFDDERRSARGAATPALHRAPREGHAQNTRTRSGSR